LDTHDRFAHHHRHHQVLKESKDKNVRGAFKGLLIQEHFSYFEFSISILGVRSFQLSLSHTHTEFGPFKCRIAHSHTSLRNACARDTAVNIPTKTKQESVGYVSVHSKHCRN
jgi:hypothetical protein